MSDIAAPDWWNRQLAMWKMIRISRWLASTAGWGEVAVAGSATPTHDDR